MVQETVFRSVLTFLDELGVYDVLLPFLLVFTIVFAILEKTKVLGVEKIEGKEYTKKNINAMVAFVAAFLVIASTQLVSIINEAVANVVLLLILAISFLLLVGVFYGSEEFTLKNSPSWLKFFMVLMFIGVVVIFLNAAGWLAFILGAFSAWNVEWTASLILIIIIFGVMWFVYKEPQRGKEKKE
jgi:hypothetical protein